MLNIIVEAAKVDIGLKIETNDPERFKQLFYRTQRKYDFKFKLLTAPVPNQLWIVKNDKATSQSNT